MSPLIFATLVPKFVAKGVSPSRVALDELLFLHKLYL